MKNKLYDFLNKRRALISILLISILMLASYLFTIANGGQLLKLGIVLMLVPASLIFFLLLEDTNRSHKKALQLLRDQHDSSSPHWDGCVRSAKDIEPRLMLLRDRIEKDQHEVNRLEQTKND
jgi:membrane protease YdiL (CAAX protease family)